MKATFEQRGARTVKAGLALSFLASIAVATSLPHAASAQGTHHDGHPNAPGAWRGDIGQWHGGHWYRGWHGNRYGWWWAVPGADWYAYDEPAYPYPAYPDTGYPAAPVAPYYWYYCQNPAGYYPYVTQCSGAWQPVPAPG